MDMHEEDIFIRNPIPENQVLFLRSTCSFCGFTILAGSLDELVEEEEQHEMHCGPLRDALEHRNATVQDERSNDQVL